ncbi:MAG TPA: hypothetical protein VE174_10260 [Actinomycetota bacterium]|nr:hypothetical protein [Actinomycetota bacterium]
MSDENPTTSTETPTRTKRPWKLRLAELFLWFAVAVITAVIMVSMSERLLPANF